MNEKMITGPSVCIDLKKYRVRIHRCTLDLLQNPRYIELLVNPKKRCFIVRTSYDHKNAHRLRIDRLPSDKAYIELYSREFIEEISTISKNLEHDRSYRIKGTMNKEKNAACFSLEETVMLEDGKERIAYA